MTTFGFSAFLRLVSLNDKPQRTAVRKRLARVGQAYDFHKSMRIRANRFLVRDEPFQLIIESTSEIRRAPERSSARHGLNRLLEWRDENPGPIFAPTAATFESPRRLFKVSFRPDFGIHIEGIATAIHIWNTARPQLQGRIVYAALSLIRDGYQEIESKPQDVGLLSLRNGQLYRLAEAADYSALARRLIDQLENVIAEEQARLDEDRPDDRPVPPA